MSDWKQNLQKFRYVMDTLLLISFMLVSAPQATGIPLHEWFSLFFIILFVIHLLLHWDWVTRSFGRLFANITARERFNIVWDYLLYLMMLLVFVSGFLVSVALLPALNISLIIQDFWSKIHHDSATFIMPMLGVHLALNFSWIVKLTKRMFAKEAK
jgi:protein-S-isoprenylcysteine O-methyltransferase Ste14